VGSQRQIYKQKTKGHSHNHSPFLSLREETRERESARTHLLRRSFECRRRFPVTVSGAGELCSTPIFKIFTSLDSSFYALSNFEVYFHKNSSNRSRSDFKASRYFSLFRMYSIKTFTTKMKRKDYIPCSDLEIQRRRSQKALVQRPFTVILFVSLNLRRKSFCNRTLLLLRFNTCFDSSSSFSQFSSLRDRPGLELRGEGQT
jgi:hypothetical protein